MTKKEKDEIERRRIINDVYTPRNNDKEPKLMKKNKFSTKEFNDE